MIKGFVFVNRHLMLSKAFLCGIIVRTTVTIMVIMFRHRTKNVYLVCSYIYVKSGKKKMLGQMLKLKPKHFSCL